MWRGALAPRRVLDLVEHLPPDSALAGALLGPEQQAWDLHAHLLAAAVDAIGMAAWVTAQSASRRRIPRPKQLPRPAPRPRATEARERRVLDLSGHPDARPIPAKYLAAMAAQT